MERQTLMIVDDPSLNRKMLIEIFGDRYNYIEAENGRQAYSLGITDYIRRPFDAFIVHRRVENTLKIHNEQKRLKNLVAAHIYEREENNDLMVRILSHVVEFHNYERRHWIFRAAVRHKRGVCSERYRISEKNLR